MATAKRYFKRLWSEWQKDEVTRHAATLSYFAVFSLPAFILVVISVAGLFIDRESVRTQFFAQVRNLSSEPLAEFLAGSIENVQNSGSSLLVNLFGFAFLLFAAVGIFKELETSMNKILNVEAGKKSGILSFLRSYALSFVLLLVVSTILIASLAAGSVLFVLRSRITEISPAQIVQLSTLNQLLSYVSLGMLFFVLYRFLPAKKFPTRAILVGTVAATTLFVLGTFFLSLYISRADVGHTYGVASSVIVLLFWIFYSTNVFLLGAEIIDAYERVVE